jgi:hypothetical protein
MFAEDDCSFLAARRCVAMFRSILAVLCSLCFIYSAVVAIDVITGYAGRASLDLNQQVQLLTAYILPLLLLGVSAALWVRVLKGRKRRRRWHPTGHGGAKDHSSPSRAEPMGSSV